MKMYGKKRTMRASLEDVAHLLENRFTRETMDEEQYAERAAEVRDIIASMG